MNAPYAFIHLSLILYNFSDGQCVLACVYAHTRVRARAHTHTHTHTHVVLLNGHHICVIEI